MNQAQQIVSGTGSGTARTVVEGPKSIRNGHGEWGNVPTPPSLRVTSPFLRGFRQ